MIAVATSGAFILIPVVYTVVDASIKQALGLKFLSNHQYKQ